MGDVGDGEEELIGRFRRWRGGAIRKVWEMERRGYKEGLGDGEEELLGGFGSWRGGAITKVWEMGRRGY